MPLPEGWSRITPGFFYDDAATAIDWLCTAFGFEVQLKVEGAGATIVHCQLVLGDGMVMASSVASAMPGYRSPRALGGLSTHYLMVYVDDVEAHCARARAAGAKIVTEPVTSDYGEEHWSDRGYEAEDLEGHRFWFAQRLRSPGA